MDNKIKIIDASGKEKDAYLITFLSLEKYNSLYLAYTEKEITDGDNIVVFGKIVEQDDKITLVDIPGEELSDVMDEFKKEYNSYG